MPKRQKTLLQQQQQQQLKKEEEEDEEEESNDSTVTRLEVPPNLAAFTQLKERAEVENQAAGSSPLRLLKIPTEPGQPIVHFFHREEEVMIIGVAGVAQLAEQFRRKAEQQQQASSSTTSRRKELFYRLKGCTIVDYFFGDEEEEEGEGEGNSNVHGRPRRRLANLMALRRHCVLLFCTRASCHFITVFESVSEALKRCQQQREMDGSEENNPGTATTTSAAKVFLRCPLCHLGTLKPNLWVRVVLEHGTQGTQRQRMTALISSPLSNVLFNADEQQLLTGPAGSTGLATAVERTMARLCPQRGGGLGGGLGGDEEEEEEKATTVVDSSRRPPRFTLVLRPALVVDSQQQPPPPENLCPVQSLFNEGLLGSENRTIFNVVGLYTADDAGDGDDHDKQPL